MDQAHDRVIALARQQDDVVTRAQVHALGLSDQAINLRRRKGWASPIRGAMVVPPVRDDARALARAALLVVGGTVCGLTAARLHRLPGLLRRDPDESVDLATPDADRSRLRGGYRRHPILLAPTEIVDLAGLRTSSVRRTLEDILLWCDRDVVITIVDAMLHERRITEADLAELRRRVEDRRGGGRARSWWVMIDGTAESPLETRLRLLLGDAGLLPDETQWPVHHPATGQLIARLDFAWPALRLAIEADGVGPHSEPQALFRDRHRQNDLVRLGWEVLRFTWHDAAPGTPSARHTTVIVRTALADRHRPPPRARPQAPPPRVEADPEA
ncbi:type IV toxin-antitoxin system AbiEi family antitoxin domain-containing protein, partial [Frankia tisae]